MTPLQRAGYLAHARTPGFTRRVAAARHLVADGLARCERPYVAFSAGKDSSAMLALVLEQWPTAHARVLTRGETRIMHDRFDEVLAWWRERYSDLVLVEVLSDHMFAPEYGHLTFDEQQAMGSGELRFRLSDVGQFDGVFIGIRAQESRHRRIALHRWGPIHQYALGSATRNTQRGMWRLAPLAWLTTHDVGAIIAQTGCPLLSAYDTTLDARTTTRYTTVAVAKGELDSTRTNNPAGWNRLAVRFDEIAWLS